MRKFSKIFAIILSICVLCCAIATTVSAASVNDLSPSATGITNVAEIDFEASVPGDNTYATSSSSGNAYSYYGWSNVRFPTVANVNVRQQTDVAGELTNNYLNFSRINGGANASAPYWEYRIANYNSRSHNIADYSYVVADFDLGCNEYSYILNGVECHGTTVPEGAENVTLAYPEQMRIYSILRAYDASNADMTTYVQIYVVTDGTNWYLSKNDTYSSDDVIVSTVAGAWNHVTVALEVNEYDPASSTLRYYLNGKLFTSGKANTKGATSVYLDSVRFSLSPNVSADGDDYFSFAIDNLTANLYAQDYSSGDDVYGIDDYYAEKNNEELNISICEDTAYNVEYSYAGTPTPFAASLEHTDGKVENFYNLSTALKNVKDGDFVNVTTPISDYIPVGENIKELTFICSDGVTVELAKEAEEYYIIQHTGNTYTMKLAEDAALVLNWYDSQGKDRKVIKTQNILPFFTPDSSADVLQIYGKLDKKNLTIEILKEWQWDFNGDGKGDGRLLSSLSVAELNEVRDMGLTSVGLVPVFETYDIAFTIEDADGNLYAPSYNYSAFTKPKPKAGDSDGLTDAEINTAVVSQLVTALSEVASGDKVVVTLYRDVTLARGNTLPVNAGATVSFDLNGKSILQTTTSTSSAEVRLFRVYEGATLNLYSTVSGGYVAQGVLDTDAVDAGGKNIGVFGYGIIAATDINSCTINIGSMKNNKNASGDNISLYGGTLINFSGSVNAVSDSKKVSININGGSYYSTVASVGAMITLNEMDMEINISGATLYSDNAKTSIFSVGDGLAASASINVTKSTIAASAPEGGVIGNWNKDCKLTVSESTVVGLSVNKSGITLGKSVLLAGEYEESYIKTTEGVVAAISNNSKTIGALTFNYPASMSKMYNTADNKLNDGWYKLEKKSVENIEYIILTITEGAENLDAPYDTIRKVTWLDTNGYVYKVEYWTVGSKLRLCDATVFGQNKEENGWYNGVYDYWKWKNVTEGIEDESTFIVADVENNCLEPIVKGYAENLSVKMSVELSEKIAYNIYLPTMPEEEKFTFDGVYLDGEALKKFEVEIDGVKYIRFTGVIGASDFASDEIVVKYTVGNNDLTKTLVFDIFEYATKVDNAYGCGTAESKLIYAVLQYKLATYIASLEEGDELDTIIVNKVDDHCAGHGSKCKCADIDYDATSEVDYADIASLVKAFAYGVTLDNDLKKTSSDFTITLSKETEIKKLEISISDEKLEGISCELVPVDAGEYVEYRLSGIALELINKTITIKVTLADDTTLTGTYDLAAYIKANDSSIAKALYVISDAAYAAKTAKPE